MTLELVKQLTAYLAPLLLLALAFIVFDTMGIFNRKNHFDVDGKTVLLTGGSQGMGLALAKILASKGANIVIVARNKAKLTSALTEIQAAARSPSQRFHSISADVTLPEESTRLLSETTAWAGSAPDIVWANAGSAHPALFAATPVETLKAQMDINYFGAAYLSHAALKLFIQPSSPPAPSSTPRHIIMTGSAACFAGLAGYAPYAPCKAAMRCLADSLRSEVLLYNGARKAGKPGAPDRDVQVHLVLPGTILSEGFEAEEMVKHPVTKILEESDPRQTPHEVAVAAVRGLERGEFMVTTQWLVWIMRTGMMGGSKRTSIVVDTIMAWITAIVWLFVGPDLDSKVWTWGRKHGVEA